ncbi:MAG: 8-oxo-dGTP diphosphatase [Clostridia bacterium]|nr:8-oxo-dGTP diphosphatase [Clostridia bacterium]
MHTPEQVIFTNMCMVYDGQGNVLVQERVDPKWPGIVFPGGHVEPGETFAQAVIREVQEETGLTIRQPRLCGVKHWHKRGVRHMVLLYKTGEYEGELHSSEEGRVWWMPLSDLPAAPLADNFENMLQVFLNDNLSEHTFRLDGDQWFDILT